MAILIPDAAPWTRQPRSGTRASNYWEKHGLVALFDTRSGTELIYGNRASALSTTIVQSSKGMGAGFSGTANQQYGHRSSYAQLGPMTVFAFLDVTTLTNYGHIIGKQGATVSNAPYEIRLGSSPTDSKINVIRAHNGGYSSTSCSTDQISAGTRANRLFVRIKNSDITASGEVFVNGVKTALVGVAEVGYTPSDTGSDVWIGRRFDGATQLDGNIYFVALFNRALTDSEIAFLDANPWQVFAPQYSEIALPSGGGTSVLPGVGTLTITGLAPTVAQTANQFIAPGVGSLTITGYAPAVAQSGSQSIAPGAGTLTITGYAPTIAQPMAVAPGVGVLTITGYAPTVAQSGSQSITPGVGTLTITGYAPTVAQPMAVAPGVGSLTIAGYAPVVVQTLNQSILPSVGALTITGYSPVVAQTANQAFIPGAGSLTITGYAPTVVQASSSPTLVPDAGVLTITGYAPTVAQTATKTGMGYKRKQPAQDDEPDIRAHNARAIQALIAVIAAAALDDIEEFI